MVGWGGQWSEVSVVGRGGQWSEVSVCVAAGIPAVQTSPERGPSSSMDRGSSSSTQREHTSTRGGQTAACSLEPFPLTIPSFFVTLHSSLPPGSISGVSAMLYSTLYHSIPSFTLSWSTVWRWGEVESLYCTLAMMPCSSPGWWGVCRQGDCSPLRIVPM